MRSFQTRRTLDNVIPLELLGCGTEEFSEQTKGSYMMLIPLAQLGEKLLCGTFNLGIPRSKKCQKHNLSLKK